MSDRRRILDELREVFGDAAGEPPSGDRLTELFDEGRDLDSEDAEQEDLGRGRRRRRSGRARRVRAHLKAELRAKKERKRRRHGPRGSRGGRRAREERELDPEEREHRRNLRIAKKRANQRIGFLTHAGSYVATLAIILLTTRSIRLTILVALSWGIGLFCHYLWGVAAPRMRDHWVEREVGTQSAKSVKSERREVETRSRRSLEDLSARVAHEIRNPITAAKSLVQQMGEDPASDENLEYAGLALSELDRVERSISHLLRYARDEQPQFQPILLQEIALSAVEGLRERARSRGVAIHFEFDREAGMRGDPEKLRRVIENLVANAVDALSDASTAEAKVEVLGGENLAGSEVWVRVRDNGPGIPVEDQEQIWSPFYTTKETGTGLGLALSRKTIEAHGGRVELLSGARKGTEFILAFPKDSSAEIGLEGVDDEN